MVLKGLESVLESSDRRLDPVAIEQAESRQVAARAGGRRYGDTTITRAGREVMVQYSMGLKLG